MREEKIKSKDYSTSERPETRTKQFFDIMRHRFVELLKLSLLQAVFNMPLIVSIVLFHILSKTATSINALMTIFIIQGLSFLISMPFAFTGLTGFFYCLKKIIHAEGEYASSSYFIGLRDEWKKGAVVGRNSDSDYPSSYGPYGRVLLNWTNCDVHQQDEICLKELIHYDLNEIPTKLVIHHHSSRNLSELICNYGYYRLYWSSPINSIKRNWIINLESQCHQCI